METEFVRSKKRYLNSEVSWAARAAIKRNRPLLSLSFLGIYILFFGLSFLYASTVKFPVRVDATGRLTSRKEPVPMKAPASFVVGSLRVKENQAVKTNEVLMTSRDTLDAKDKAALKEFLTSTTSLVEDDPSGVCAKCLPKIQKLTLIYSTIRAHGEVQGLITPINDILRELTNEIEQYNQIEASVTDLRMNIKLNEKKLSQIRVRKAESDLAREVEQLETATLTDKTKIQSRFQAAKLDISRVKSLIKSRVGELNSKLELFEKTFNVIAPFSGTVTNLRVKGEGELLGEGQVLLELVPANMELVGKIEVQNEDISKVQVGDEVIVSIDALPEVDYGTVTGSVTEILRTEELAGNVAGTRATASYPVMVQLSKQSLDRQGKSTNFILGMSIRARVVSEYETLLKTFMKNLVKTGEKAGVK